MQKPEFCPNKCCKEHKMTKKEGSWYQKWGKYTTRTFGDVQRYRCICCGRTFSDQSFSLDYYAKKIIDYESVLQDITTSSGVRDIARRLKVSTSTVQNRTARLAHQAIYTNEKLLKEYSANEELCADGFESFNVSQYFPNNTHVLLGSQSQFICGIDSVTIRRKGRMTENQKQKRMETEKLYRAPAGGIGKSFKSIALRAMEICNESGQREICLNTDKHKSYPYAIKAAQREWKKNHDHVPVAINHVRVSSKKPRTRSNIIYASNYMDREFRKDLAPYVRESVEFSRNYNDDMYRLSSYCFKHNFLKTYRIKNERYDKRTHAEVAGIKVEKIDDELKDIYTKRRFLSHLEEIRRGCGSFDYLKRLWLRQLETPLKGNADYAPAYFAD